MLVSACAQSPCLNGGLCQMFNASFIMCYCKSGFTGSFCQNSIYANKTLCEMIPMCDKIGVFLFVCLLLIVISVCITILAILLITLHYSVCCEQKKQIYDSIYQPENETSVNGQVKITNLELQSMRSSLKQTGILSSCSQTENNDSPD